MRTVTPHPEAATTLVEVLVSIMLFAAFCGSIFELNAVCLRYVDASKESVAALESVHDRCEVLRNLAFTDLINASYVQNLLATAANGSDFCKKATEVVKFAAYPNPDGVTQFTRTPGGIITINSIAIDLGSTLVQIDVSTSWNTTLGGDTHSEEISTIISNGSKK